VQSERPLERAPASPKAPLLGPSEPHTGRLRVLPRDLLPLLPEPVAPPRGTLAATEMRNHTLSRRRGDRFLVAVVLVLLPIAALVFARLATELRAERGVLASPAPAQSAATALVPSSPPSQTAEPAIPEQPAVPDPASAASATAAPAAPAAPLRTRRTASSPVRIDRRADPRPAALADGGAGAAPPAPDSAPQADAVPALSDLPSRE
jgi:hypothetical protein